MIIVLLLSMANRGYAEETIHVLKIDPDARAAVVKISDGDLRVIRQGDVVKPIGRVLSITDGCIVLQNAMAEKVILRIVGGKQIIERIGKIDRTSKHKVVIAVPTDGRDTDSNKRIGTSRKIKP
jgi:hypothetical protein